MRQWFGLEHPSELAGFAAGTGANSVVRACPSSASLGAGEAHRSSSWFSRDPTAPVSTLALSPFVPSRLLEHGCADARKSRKAGPATYCVPGYAKTESRLGVASTRSQSARCG